MRVSSIIFGFLARVLGSVLIVALLIYLALPAQAVFGSAISGLRQLPQITLLLDRASKSVDEQFKVAEGRVSQLEGKSKSAVDSRITEIDKELTALQKKPHVQGASYLEMARLLHQGHLEEAIGNDIQRSVLKQERHVLQNLSTSIQNYADPKAREQRVENARVIAARKKQAEDEAREKVSKLNERAMCRVLFTECSKDLDKAKEELKKANTDAWNAYNEFKRESEAPRPSPVVPKIVSSFDRSDMRAKLAALQMEISRIEGLHLHSLKPVRDALYTASLVVAGALLAGLLFKIFFYYFLAPLAARCSPMVVRAANVAEHTTDAGKSGLSVTVEMTPDQELVVVGSFLQSVSDGAKTRTKLLFSNWHPLTSFLSGLWMMTKLRVKSPSQVVLSATTDPLQELNVVRLHAGESLVLLPRHLVGVIHAAKRQPRLRGTWKFGVHAFLTMQFRYLAISGPCTLVVSGCRGVRIERAESGRLVSQAMTVGFSANLAYSVARTETFIPYLLGQRPLFNDRFKGAGTVLYQEVPAGATRGGFTGRGLQGILDGVLKAFGI
jgi:uncharacterized protein (AIM24 family)